MLWEFYFILRMTIRISIAYKKLYYNISLKLFYKKDSES